MNTVLYINGKLGVWMCFEHGTCVNVHTEKLTVGKATYQPCAWLASGHQLVTLMIDSEHAEIDAYPLQPHGSAVQQLSHRRAFRKTLIDRFPDAIIRTPDKSTGLDTLLVQKLNLSESIRQWLAYVEQSNIIFRSVATSAETVASLFDTGDRPYLVLCNVLGYCKHTFCISGHALFTRTLKHTKSFSIIGGLEETLSHLRMTGLIDKALPVHLVGLSVEQLNGASALEWVEELVQCDESEVLAVDDQQMAGDDAMQYGAVVHIAQHALMRRTLQQHGLKRHVSMALTKHQKFISHRRSRFQLAVLSILVICTAGYNGSNLLDRQRGQSDFVQTKAALGLAIDDARQAVLDESPVGIKLSDALFDVEALQASSGPSTEILFSIIAAVFTANRELVLQELSWVTLDNASTEATGIGKVATNQVTFRDRTSTESEAVSNLLVTVIGKSYAGATLREQQTALNATISMLDQYSSISQLVVLEAPLANATNEDGIGADALDLAAGFRIQFQVDRSSSREV